MAALLYPTAPRVRSLKNRDKKDGSWFLVLNDQQRTTNEELRTVGNVGFESPMLHAPCSMPSRQVGDKFCQKHRNSGTLEFGIIKEPLRTGIERLYNLYTITIH